MAEREQSCFWCGKSLGVYSHYPGDPPECCGDPECERELRDSYRTEQAERRERAEEDGYGRYSR